MALSCISQKSWQVGFFFRAGKGVLDLCSGPQLCNTATKSWSLSAVLFTLVHSHSSFRTLSSSYPILSMSSRHLHAAFQPDLLLGHVLRGPLRWCRPGPRHPLGPPLHPLLLHLLVPTCVQSLQVCATISFSLMLDLFSGLCGPNLLSVFF